MAADWRLGLGYAAQRPAGANHFHALYDGKDYNHPERGQLAMLAFAHTQPHAAAIAAHSFAEGYYGAKRTLSPGRAASLSLTAINRWLFGQRDMGPVSLTAILFQKAGKIGLAHLGAGILLRYRNKTLTPLLHEHVRPQPDAPPIPTRAIGLAEEISLDFLEDTAEQADRYVFVTGVETPQTETIFATLTAHLATPEPEACAQAVITALGNLPGQDKAALVLDVLDLPPAEKRDDLTGLRLRPAPREGDVWDGFIIGKTLYRGRYTTLKAAYDSVEKREVALKIPLPAMLQDEVFTAGFIRETWIGSTVSGNNIARYLDLPPERRSSLYLVMPLYKGETLARRLIRPPPVSLPEGIGIAIKLCEAVQDLAAIQVIHRDIKPENIMLREQGEVLLLDLGLAYLPGIDLADTVKPGGTIRYMAPELLRGTQANARSEVFALGVTIYRMFSAGPFPFGQSETIPLAKMRPDLPSWLGHILAIALSSDPALRYPDAAALSAALHNGLVTGTGDPPKPPPRITPLLFWQLATFLFAAMCAFLLLRK